MKTDIESIMALMGAIIGDMGNVESVECIDNDKLGSDPQPTTHYITIGDVSDPHNHGGIIVIASRVFVEGKTIIYGVSYCNKADVYDKHIGRKIAYDRLTGDFGVVAYKDKNHDEILFRTLCDIIATAGSPDWAEPVISDRMFELLAGDHKEFIATEVANTVYDMVMNHE